MSKHDEYQKGYAAGYQDGYAKGRVAATEDARQERERRSQDDKRNGWVQVTPMLAEYLELPEDVSEVYVLRGISGEIIGMTDTR